VNPGNDEGRPRQGDQSSSSSANQMQDTTIPRQRDSRHAEPLNVWAHAYLVVGWRGRCRMVLVVARCPYCKRPHSHTGKPDFLTGKRTASCHLGRYVVHVGTVEGEVAA
jgi:hypothetical protein